MIIGQDVAIRTDDDSGTKTSLSLFCRWPIPGRAEELLEEGIIEERLCRNFYDSRRGNVYYGWQRGLQDRCKSHRMRRQCSASLCLAGDEHRHITGAAEYRVAAPRSDRESEDASQDNGDNDSDECH